MLYVTKARTLPPYMAYPRFLVSAKLSDTSKMVYMILLNRTRLSQQNSGWEDDTGHIYVYYPIEDLAALLHKSDRTIKSALKELSDYGLLYRQRQGVGKANKLYIKIPFTEEVDCPPDRKKSAPAKGKKLPGSNNKGRKEYKDKINYDHEEDSL